MDTIDFTELEQVLQDYAREAEEIYRYQISLGGHNASRKLFDSVKSEIQVGDTGYEVYLNLEKYWKYLEGGSKGTQSSPPGAVFPAHFPPADDLVKWINVKPIIPRPMENGKLPSPETLAFLIGRKIHQEGIEPYPALAQTQIELDQIYDKKIQDALNNCISNYIIQFIYKPEA